MGDGTETDTQAQRAEQFLALHRPGDPLLLPNAWDVGSAALLAWLGFRAVATTSSGFAATLGRLDGEVGRDAAIRHSADLAAAVPVPVSADLENGFGDAPEEVAETVRLAVEAGLAGCSIEDSTGRDDEPIYDIELAVDRIRAAVETAHRGPVHLVLTARAENFLHDRPDLADTVERLQRYEAAGADVLYAPGLVRAEDIATVVREVTLPVNVLARPNGPSVRELAAAGVARVSVGGAFAYTAFGALVEAARELQQGETASYFRLAGVGSQAVHAAFARASDDR